MTFTLCWCLLCGWLNRWRGSGKGQGSNIGWSSTIQRIVLSVVLALPAIVASPWHGAAIAVLLFWPGFAMGWGSYFDLSDRPNPPEVRWIDYVTRKMTGVRRDYVAMSLRGLHFTVPTAIVASLVNPVALIMAPFGVLMAPAYLIPKELGIHHHTPVGEWVFGAILGATMFDMGVLMFLN